MRVSRPATPVIYNNLEEFTVGKAKIVRKSDSDQVLVVAAGITLAETMKAADMLAAKGINIRVMDPFTIKWWKSYHHGGSLPIGRYWRCCA